MDEFSKEEKEELEAITGGTDNVAFGTKWWHVREAIRDFFKYIVGAWLLILWATVLLAGIIAPVAIVFMAIDKFNS